MAAPPVSFQGIMGPLLALVAKAKEAGADVCLIVQDVDDTYIHLHGMTIDDALDALYTEQSEGESGADDEDDEGEAEVQREADKI